MDRICKLAFCIMALSAIPYSAHTSQYIWIEGEEAAHHNMQRHNWYDDVNKEALSGGEWLSHFADGTAPEAEYRFDVDEAGEYAFWIRANSAVGARISYRLNDDDWVEVDTRGAIENLNIASNGAPDMRFISWIRADDVTLGSGPQVIRFRFHSRNNNHGGLDCFLFTRDPFMPRGALKPGERSGLANPGYFAWEPEMDLFTGEALVDLRRLNEDVAGQDGYVRAEGNEFVLGSGKKVKFWGVNIGPGLYSLDRESHIYLAKHLAKHGVNLARLHGSLYGNRNPTINREKLDGLHHLVWALKQEGIYTVLSFYFPLWYYLDDDQHPFMLLYFDPEMQDLYFGWADTLLNTENPYTGARLGKDPAVAIVEVVNEDSHFFWTFKKDNMQFPRWEHFTKLYGDWLVKKYGSLDEAIRVWGEVQEPDDAPDVGRMTLHDAWQMTTNGVKSNPRRTKRVGDQVQFLTENMRDFYQRAANHFHEQCGYAGLVSCSNWHTADAKMLDALERYCYTVGDVIDRHGYYGAPHRGEGASWSVRPGQSFESRSALYLQNANPLPYVETDGYPNIISEIGWPMPNMYRAEAAFLTAAYGSLQGLDGIIHFAVGSTSWDQNANKFVLNDPVGLGSYFASALAYRNGYIQESPTLIMDHIQVRDLYAMRGSEVHAEAAFDQLRAAQVPDDAKQNKMEGIDPLSFYAGRVARRFGDSSEVLRHRSTDSLIDHERKRIQSITSELAWDYRNGIATVNAARVQGGTGFLGRVGTVQLSSVSIQMKNDYGTVMVVAMDNQPLAESRKILVQCMTVDQLHGWGTSEPGGMSREILDLGSAPWGVERFDVSITLKLAGQPRIKLTACDENGYPTDKLVRHSVEESQLQFGVDPTTAYTVIERID